MGVSNAHGSMLMYLLERGFLNAKEVKSCVLIGMDWEGRGEGERSVTLRCNTSSYNPHSMPHTHTHTPHPILCNQFLPSCTLNVADEGIQ